MDAALISLSFGGRIGRLRYMTWMIPVSVAAMAIVIFAGLMAVASASHGTPGSVVPFAVIGLAVFAYSIRLAVLRLHDIGWSGWFVLLQCVPYVGVLLLLPLLFWPGRSDENEYGPPPGENSGLVIVGAILVVLAWAGAILFFVRHQPPHAPPASPQALELHDVLARDRIYVV